MSVRFGNLRRRSCIAFLGELGGLDGRQSRETMSSTRQCSTANEEEQRALFTGAGLVTKTLLCEFLCDDKPCRHTGLRVFSGLWPSGERVGLYDLRAYKSFKAVLLITGAIRAGGLALA